MIAAVMISILKPFDEKLFCLSAYHSRISNIVEELFGLMKQQSDYLQAMGIDEWELRQSAQEPHEQALLPVEQLDWASLADRVSQCTACDLHKSRTQTVFGVGHRQADLMCIGEAPGAREDAMGEPFVGRAGQLLDQILKAIDLDREHIFIANILKCRPPDNRDPDMQEVNCCTPYLKRQIELLQPKLIVALGRIAAQYLLNTKTSLSQLRQQQHYYQQVPLLVTYHPAYLLRNPPQKAKAWQDWQYINHNLTQGLAS